MTLDEAIKDMGTIAEECQRVVDTGIVFDNVTIDELYCDDTELIEENLAKHQKAADHYRQLAEWLKELKQLREQESKTGYWIEHNSKSYECSKCHNTKSLYASYKTDYCHDCGCRMVEP